MILPGPSAGRWLLLTSVLLLPELAAGCGEAGPEVYPVTGLVTVDAEPLDAHIGAINLVPDKARGNVSTLIPTGYLDGQGSYTVYYAQGKKGAPPGWYKVQIVASQLGDGPPISTPRPRGRGKGPPARLFDNKYTRADKSGLAFEVVKDPAPGAYDLKLTK